jgi:hypothetical protein
LSRHGTDYAQRNRILKSERAPYREYHLSGFKIFRIPERHRRQVSFAHLDDGQVGFRIHSDELTGHGATACGENGVSGRRYWDIDPQILRPTDDMCIRYDETFRVDNHA